jgi:hypothetical protein
MSESGELGVSLAPEELTAWTEAKERANRCGLALVIALRAVEGGPTPTARLRAVPPARAAIDDVEKSRGACLDLLEQMLLQHGKAPATIEERRTELRTSITNERDKLAALEQALIETVGPLSQS